MALVRCPTHKIPYNDDNPRGCPACAREKGGKARVSVMQELAKAQRPDAPPAQPAPEPSSSTSRQRLEERGAPPTHPAYRRSPSAATPAPSPPVAKEAPFRWFSRDFLQRRFRPIAVGAIVVLTITLLLSWGPRFREGMYPVAATGTPRPLPLNPNVNITVAFSALGARAPKANPDSPRLAQYTYGTDLTVDASNGVVYAITVRIPNRSWRGLHAGMPERTARGALGLLGTPTEPSSAAVPQPEEVGGYWVYPSLDGRPRRTLLVEVRPPNGCFDVQVELQPQAIGTLQDGDRRYAVVGTESAALDWVVTQVRVVSRSIRGPYSGEPAC